MSQDFDNERTQPAASDLDATNGPLPSRIAGFSVRRRIASGGMGVVYEATQDEPRRTVAIKVIRPDTVSAEALGRFQFEASLLARLQHPGIAQIYEVGTFDDGGVETPYFAMEYIPNAKPITEYVRERHLGLRERMELFAQVCDAVHHGHQKGIVHRDLKPGNILVDANGRPRVIDFGVARSTDYDLAHSGYRTQMGQVVGSLPYMSPEQFEGNSEEIDTRSDVYSLGVVLYELLSGRHPYEFSASRIHELAAKVRKETPTALGQIDPQLKGDAETIVGKAMAQDRELRYQSAFGLAEDIRRYLSGEAIAARPMTIRYQMEIFARRNRALLAAMFALGIILVGSVVISGSLFYRAQTERGRAEQAQATAEEEKARAQAAVEFLEEILTSSIPRSYGTETTMLDMLDHASLRVEEAFADQPAVEGRLRRMLAVAYLHQLELPRALDHGVAALHLLQASLGEEAQETREWASTVAFYYRAMGRYDDLAKLMQELHQVEVRCLGPGHEETLGSEAYLAYALEANGNLEEALTIAKRVMDSSRENFGPEDPRTLDPECQYAWLLMESGQVSEAFTQASSSYQKAQEKLGSDHEVTRAARSTLAAVLIAQGDFSSAEVLYGRRIPDDLGIERHFQGKAKPGDDTRLLVFWEEWCPFSQRALPRLEKHYQNYRSSGLEVLALTRVNRNATDEKVERYLEDNDISFTVVKEDGRAWNWFDCTGTPSIYLVREGRVIWENKLFSDTPISVSMLRALARGE